LKNKLVTRREVIYPVLAASGDIAHIVATPHPESRGTTTNWIMPLAGIHNSIGVSSQSDYIKMAMDVYGLGFGSKQS
jgi:hypothetical protein